MSRHDGRPPGAHLAAPIHLLAATMVLIPAAGFLLAAAAPGAEGILGRARMFTLMVDSGLWPVAGLVAGLAAASALQQRRLGWTYTGASALLGTVFLLLMPLYVLDVVQLRAGVGAEMRPIYDGNVVRNVLALLVYGSVLVLQAWLSVRIWRRTRAERVARRADEEGPALISDAPPRRARARSR